MKTYRDISNKRVHELGARVPLFTLNGKAPGPRFVVIGDEAVLRQVADLAWNLPNLVAIHGTLVLRATQSDLGLDRACYVLRLDADDTDPEAVLARIMRRMAARGMVPDIIAIAA